MLIPSRFSGDFRGSAIETATTLFLALRMWSSRTFVVIPSGSSPESELSTMESTATLFREPNQ